MGLSKFRKAMEKQEKFNIGFAEIPDWISTGNAGLNAILSGDMLKGVPVGRSTIISGLNGSGKSFLLGNMFREAQKKGYFVVFLDTEFAAGGKWMTDLGVDVSPEKFMPVNVGTVEECIDFLSDLFKTTKPDEKIFIGLDSLSNLELEGDVKKFEEGNVAYGQGLLQKLYKQMVANTNRSVGGRETCFVTTTHMYVAGSDHYGNPILKPNCGEGTLFIPSAGLTLTKRPLREGKEITGITVSATTYKTRFTSLGRKTEFDIPYDTGMEFLDGALEILIDCGIVTGGGWNSYIDRETGEEIKFQKSKFHEHSDKLMGYYSQDVGEVEEKDEADASIEMIEAATEAVKKK